MLRPKSLLVLGILVLALSSPIASEAARVRATTHRDSLALARLAETRVLYDARRWAPADSLAGLVIERAEQSRPPDSLSLASALRISAMTKHWRVQFSNRSAIEEFERSIRIQERLGVRADTLEWLGALHGLGRFYLERQSADSALVPLRRARALCRHGVVAEDSIRAAVWISTGLAHRLANRVDAAIACYDSARMQLTETFGANHPGIAEAYVETGAVYAREHRFDEAEIMIRRSIAILEGSDKAPKLAILTPLAELSNVQKHLGDMAGSLETLERAIAIRASVDGPDSPRLILLLANIGLRFYEFGDYASSNKMFATLLPRAEAAFGVGSGRTEGMRYYTGATALQIGDTTAAALHLTRAREALRGKPLDGQHMANVIEFAYSDLLRQRGDVAGARQVAADALVRELESGHTFPDIALELLAARASGEMAAHDRAAVDNSVRELTARLGGGAGFQGVAKADAMRLRMTLHHWLGRDELAWKDALASEALDRERVMQNARALSDRRALQLANTLGEGLEMMSRISGDDPERIAVAWDRLVQRRGVVTGELARRRAPRELASDRELAAAHAAWVQAMRHQARREVAGGDDAAALEVSRNEAEAAERRYAGMAANRGVALDTVPMSLARVRATLARDQALVSLFTLAASSDTARVIAFVTVGPAGALHRVDLGPAGALDAAVAAWRRTLEQPPVRGRERAAERACRARGADVRALTWDRLAPRIAGAQRVTLVADGALGDLPWAALPADGDRYLAEAGPEIETPEAERELMASRTHEGTGLLAVGDPDFDLAGDGLTASAAPAALRSLTGNCTGTATIALAPLPGARAEAEEIARLWDGTHADAPSRAALLTGSGGSERAFKDAAPVREVIHVATHGIVWGDSCAPVLAGTRGVGGVDPVAERKSKKPKRSDTLVASAGGASLPAPVSSSTSPALRPSPWSSRRVWLALAGANHARAGSADENEGMLTADEVTTLDLSGVDWVVLSACQSGLGAQWPLEGSLGMRRAFRLAGARAVFSSQWPIADQSTREWMRALYTARPAATGARRADVPAGAALRAANRAVLTARRREHRTTHPFYWAAFTATGR